MKFAGINVESALTKRQTAFFLMDDVVCRRLRAAIRDCKSSGYRIQVVRLEWQAISGAGEPGTQFIHVKVDCDEPGQAHMSGFVMAYCPGCRTVYQSMDNHPEKRCNLRAALDVISE